jgi:hypothetical protein
MPRYVAESSDSSYIDLRDVQLGVSVKRDNQYDVAEGIVLYGAFAGELSDVSRVEYFARKVDAPADSEVIAIGSARQAPYKLTWRALRPGEFAITGKVIFENGSNVFSTEDSSISTYYQLRDLDFDVPLDGLKSALNANHPEFSTYVNSLPNSGRVFDLLHRFQRDFPDNRLGVRKHGVPAYEDGSNLELSAPIPVCDVDLTDPGGANLLESEIVIENLRQAFESGEYFLVVEGLDINTYADGAFTWPLDEVDYVIRKGLLSSDDYYLDFNLFESGSNSLFFDRITTYNKPGLAGVQTHQTFAASRVLVHNDPEMEVQVTLLDAYMPLQARVAYSLLGEEVMNRMDSVGEITQWFFTDHIFSRDILTGSGTQSWFSLFQLPIEYSEYGNPYTVPNQGTVTEFIGSSSTGIVLSVAEPELGETTQWVYYTGTYVPPGQVQSNAIGGYSLIQSVTYSPLDELLPEGAEILESQTGTILDVSSLVGDVSGSYFVIYTSESGSRRSGTIQLEKEPSIPEIIGDPGDLILRAGDSGELFINANGSPRPNYEWSKDGAILIDELGNRISFQNVGEDEPGEYSVTVYNTQGAVPAGVANLHVIPTDAVAELSPAFLIASQAGGLYPLSVTADSGWVSDESEDWVDVSPQSSTGSGQMDITVSGNNTGNPRYGDINVLDTPVKVIQAASDGCRTNSFFIAEKLYFGLEIV